MRHRRPTPDPLQDAVHGRALTRGLQVLETIAHGGRDGLRIIDLCRTCGLERPTVYRLIATLIAGGHVERCGRYRYGPGPALRRLGGEPAPSDLAAALQPVLATISRACGDAAFAVIREAHLSCCIARQVGAYPIQILTVQIGTRQPLGVGAAGLALLAALDDETVRSIIDACRPTLADYGGMSVTLLKSLVRSTRQRGWSVIGNHAIDGVLGVGMAVHDADDRPVAAVSVAAAVERMPRSRQVEIAAVMRDALASMRASPTHRSRRAPTPRPGTTPR